MVDEQQMSFFEEGGMSAPEVEADPVSGNEVPPGSLPEEVRDDVDAKLSTGEYVVPADVLRYYGMKFFEDLRATAKESLAEMDSDGRIGGEPMEDQEGTSEGLSEQEMALLQEIMSEGGNPELTEGGEPQFNQGGMVLQNPEFYPKVGMAEGGMATRSSFNPNQWRDVGSSLSTTQSGGSGIGVGSYYKTYVGPNGETRLILFASGEPTTPIPEGFTEQKSAASEVQEAQAKEELSPGNDSESEQRRQEAMEDADDAQSWAEKNYDAVSGDPISFGLEQLQGGFGDRLGGQAGRIGGALMGPVGAIGGGLVGVAMQLDNVANARAAREVAKAAGLDTTGLDAEIEKYTSGLSGVAKTLDGLGFASGKKKFDSLTNLNRTVPQTEAVFSTTRTGSGAGGFASTSSEAESRARDIASNLGVEDLEDGSDRMRTEKAKTTEGTVTTVGGTGEGNAGISVRSGSAAPTESSRPQGRPNMNKGGLVKRRKKKTTKT